MKKVIVLLSTLILGLLYGANSIGLINLGLPYGYFELLNKTKKEIPKLKAAGFQDVNIRLVNDFDRIKLVIVEGTWRGEFSVSFEPYSVSDLDGIKNPAVLDIPLMSEKPGGAPHLHYRFNEGGAIEKELGVSIKSGADLFEHLGPIVKYLIRNRDEYTFDGYNPDPNVFPIFMEESELIRYSEK